jgi:hypothetical protein
MSDVLEREVRALPTTDLAKLLTFVADLLAQQSVPQQPVERVEPFATTTEAQDYIDDVTSEWFR